MPLEILEAGTEQPGNSAVEGSVCSSIVPCPTGTLAVPGRAGNCDATCTLWNSYIGVGIELWKASKRLFWTESDICLQSKELFFVNLSSHRFTNFGLCGGEALGLLGVAAVRKGDHLCGYLMTTGSILSILVSNTVFYVLISSVRTALLKSNGAPWVLKGLLKYFVPTSPIQVNCAPLYFTDPHVVTR